MSLSGTKIKDNQAVLLGSIDGPAIRYEDSQIRRDAKGRLFYSSSRRLTKEAMLFLILRLIFLIILEENASIDNMGLFSLQNFFLLAKWQEIANTVLDPSLTLA